MKWASAISEASHTGLAVAEAAAAIREQLGGATPDLIVLFASTHHLGSYHELGDLVLNELGEAPLVGCSGGGIIGSGKEIERRPALSITAASLPGVNVHAAHLEPSSTKKLSRAALCDALEMAPHGDDEPPPSFVVLADPFSVVPDPFVTALDDAFVGAAIVGGLVSGAGDSDARALFLGSDVAKQGAVLLALSGNITMDTLIAQGCRPIGEVLLVSSAEANLILKLGGKAPTELLRTLYLSLGDRDKELFRSSLFLGVQARDQREYQPGDFLMRHMLGVDPRQDAIVVSAPIEQWQAVQFHLRDADTSREDLERHLKQYREQHPHQTPAGALLFSCLGRGAALYGQSDHDSDLFREHLRCSTLGGFFCNGEIGPVAGRTFVHRYTSAFAIFRVRDAG